MNEKKTSPYAPRVIARNVIGVHSSLGVEAQTCNVAVPRPMPCIVILIHGVNDVGEAYQNQEKGIIAGLGKRLNRSDLYAHEWHDFIAMHNEAAQKKITAPGRSPVIPFYWGYKPVTHEDWKADQKSYREAVEIQKQGDDAHIPYDTYQEDNEKKMAAVGNDGSNAVKYQTDNFKNALDVHYAKGGGTFANATTNIPDMLGPGAGGAAVAAAGFATLYMNGGDYTHPIFPNPHRIYQFFAAQRLADLIIQIRNEPETKHDAINIVAHSQGTIITMLANMLVKEAGHDPANCVILNHSPYSLESRLSEDIQFGHHQTGEARQKTFRNFCNLMAQSYQGGEVTDDEIKVLEGTCALRKAGDHSWREDARYRRNNNGKVYNYFCPNDGTVSLANIQGLGWRGIPKEIAQDIPNLRQRVFHQHGWVGTAPVDTPFVLPPAGKGDFKYSTLSNASYSARDVVVNGEELPETFMFKLQGQDNHPDNAANASDAPYTSDIDPESPDYYISYSAKAYALKRTDSATYSVSRYQSIGWTPGHILTADELKVESYARGLDIIHGVVSGTKDFQNVTLTWNKSREALEKEWQQSDPVSYSQHSSIVMSEFAPSHAMAFDLAIGPCRSFDYKAGRFWEDLLHRADWRDPMSKDESAKKYYRTGQLPIPETKFHMNKPEDVLPKGDFGVDNQYMNAKKVIPARYPETENREVANLQWDMPKTLTDYQLEHGA